MGKFRQILTELSARDTPIFSFPDNNLSKCQGILTKPGMCIDIKEIWFGIANGQISSMSDRVICQRHDNGRVFLLNVFIYLFFIYFFFFINHKVKIYTSFLHKNICCGAL